MWEGSLLFWKHTCLCVLECVLVLTDKESIIHAALGKESMLNARTLILWSSVDLTSPVFFLLLSHMRVSMVRVKDTGAVQMNRLIQNTNTEYFELFLRNGRTLVITVSHNNHVCLIGVTEVDFVMPGRWLSW